MRQSVARKRRVHAEHMTHVLVIRVVVGQVVKVTSRANIASEPTMTILAMRDSITARFSRRASEKSTESARRRPQHYGRFEVEGARSETRECALTKRKQPMQGARTDSLAVEGGEEVKYAALQGPPATPARAGQSAQTNSSRSAFASFRSAVSKPSLNQP